MGDAEAVDRVERVQTDTAMSLQSIATATVHEHGERGDGDVTAGAGSADVGSEPA